MKRRLSSSSLLQRLSHRLWLALPTLTVFACLVCDVAWARGGGGHSYSGGHSSGGGGYSSGGGSYSGGGGGAYYGGSGGGMGAYLTIQLILDLIRFVLFLTLTHPLIGIPLDLFIFWVIWKILNSSEQLEFLGRAGAPSDSEQSEQVVRSIGASTSRQSLERLRAEQDPDFSTIHFEDFIYALFAETHKLRGAHRLDDLADRLSEETIAQLKAYHSDSRAGVREVNGIVIGASTLTRVTGLDMTQVRIVVEFEANYTETLADGKQQSWYAVEQWTYVRNRGVLSHPPDLSGKALLVSCPACGAPPAKTPQGTCASCGRRIRSGEFDWFVASISIQASHRPPLLTSTVAEEGTDLPTVYDPGLAAGQRALMAGDPSFDMAAFDRRVRWIFLEIQDAWTQRKWEKARPHETDSLFQTHSYWIGEYRKQRYINELSDISISQIDLVRVAEDKYYSSITVRIFASMNDCTKSEDGRLISGSTSSQRAFSEYWTLIRSRRPKAAQAPKSDNPPELSCPACGAPLKINMAGNCEYCSAKVTSGEFDWVLSRIEQDEAYAG
jgi:predicted lipid-binding transport protein (Tim44 family)